MTRLVDSSPDAKHYEVGKAQNQLAYPDKKAFTDDVTHRHNWIAAEWHYQYSNAPYPQITVRELVFKQITKLYCPDCKQTQSIDLNETKENK